jgi:hypothetical protein
MPCLARLFRTLLGGRPTGGQPTGEVVLRHASSGRVLRSDDATVCFATAREATAFSARFLDEPDNWEAVPVGEDAARHAQAA